MSYRRGYQTDPEAERDTALVSAEFAVQETNKCKHKRSTGNPGVSYCQHCNKDVHFNCTRCGPVVVQWQINPNGGNHGYACAEPCDKCPKCARLLWEVLAWQFNPKGEFRKDNKTRTTSATYRWLIKATGATPGDKVTLRPIAPVEVALVVTLVPVELDSKDAPWQAKERWSNYCPAIDKYLAEQRSAAK